MQIEESRLHEIVSSSTSRMQLWGQILRAAEVENIVEIGVWKGDFAKEVLQQSEFIERYYMIDPWANLPDWNKPYNVATEIFEDIYKEAMDKTEFASSKRIVLRGRTKDVIDDIPDNSLDFAYIDGDHTLRGITIDLMKLLPKIKENGFIAGDDFTNNPWQHDVRFEPTLVCPFSIYFAEAMDYPVTALPFNQFFIHKKSESSFSFNDTTGDYSNIALNKMPTMLTRYRGKVKHALGAIGLIK